MKCGLNRRDLMKTGVAGVAAGAWSALGGRAARGATVSKPQITVAGYDHMIAFAPSWMGR